MTIQVLKVPATPARRKQYGGKPTSDISGVLGLPMIADVILVIGVALTASLLGLAIGALLGNIVFPPEGRHLVVSVHEQAVPPDVGAAAKGRGSASPPRH